MRCRHGTCIHLPCRRRHYEEQRDEAVEEAGDVMWHMRCLTHHVCYICHMSIRARDDARDVSCTYVRVCTSCASMRDIFARVAHDALCVCHVSRVRHTHDDDESCIMCVPVSV